MNAPRIHTAEETSARREAEIARNAAARGGAVAPGERRWSITPTEGAPLLVTTDRICPSDPCWIARLSPTGTDTAIGESEREAVVTLAGRLGYVGAIVAPVVDYAVDREVNDLRASLGAAIVDRDIAEKSSDALRAELAAAHAHIAVLERVAFRACGYADDLGEKLAELEGQIVARDAADAKSFRVETTLDALYVLRAAEEMRDLWNWSDDVYRFLDDVASSARSRLAGGPR